MPSPDPSAPLDITDTPATHAPPRPYLQVFFACAHAYLRVYRSADETRYLARCPKCAREVRFQVGEGGTTQRQFHVSCTGS